MVLYCVHSLIKCRKVGLHSNIFISTSIISFYFRKVGYITPKHSKHLLYVEYFNRCTCLLSTSAVITAMPRYGCKGSDCGWGTKCSKSMKAWLMHDVMCEILLNEYVGFLLLTLPITFLFLAQREHTNVSDIILWWVCEVTPTPVCTLDWITYVSGITYRGSLTEQSAVNFTLNAPCAEWWKDRFDTFTRSFSLRVSKLQISCNGWLHRGFSSYVSPVSQPPPPA